MFEHSEQLPKEAGSAARARRVLEHLDGRVAAHKLADAKLLVSELIANVVDHVPEPGPIGLAVAMRERTLRVEVRDPGRGFVPQPREPGSPKSSGWGLHFVSLLATRWAVEREGGSLVWFELDLAPTA